MICTNSLLSSTIHILIFSIIKLDTIPLFRFLPYISTSSCSFPLKKQKNSLNFSESFGICLFFLIVENIDPCFLQHPFDVHAVSGSWVIDEYVGDRSNQFSVLNDRASAHSLDDSSRFFKQPLFGHFNDHPFCRRERLRDGIDEIGRASCRD